MDLWVASFEVAHLVLDTVQLFVWHAAANISDCVVCLGLRSAPVKR